MAIPDITCECWLVVGITSVAFRLPTDIYKPLTYMGLVKEMRVRMRKNPPVLLCRCSQPVSAAVAILAREGRGNLCLSGCYDARRRGRSCAALSPRPVPAQGARLIDK